MGCLKRMLDTRRLFGLLIGLLVTGMATADVPDTLTCVVDSQWTLHLTRESFRGDSFEVLVQNDEGEYDTYDAGEVRTFVGTVDEDVSASAAAYYKQDGTLIISIIFDRGGTYIYDDGQQVYENGWEDATYAYPTQPTLSVDHVGTDMYEYGIGYDVDYAGYSGVYGSDTELTVDWVEFNNLHMAQVQMRCWQLKPVVQRVVIRGSQDQDPYNGMTTTNDILSELEVEWYYNQSDAKASTFKRAGLTGATSGGLAYSSGSYTVSSLKDYGFSTSLRHELGHNFGIADNDAGDPEDGTLMCGNQRARYCGPAVEDALDHRDKKMYLEKLISVGTYTAVAIPPYAALDIPEEDVYEGSAITMDVLANDFDANGETLTLISCDAETALGGSVQLSVGTGEDGRNELLYTAPVGEVGSTDSFCYTIQDASGQTATGVVVAKSLTAPLASYETDADTYVNSINNNGSETEIVVKRYGDPNSYYTRTGWVHFDLTDVEFAEAAQLKFVVESSDTSGTLSVWGIKDGVTGDTYGTDWTETEITRSNAPLMPDFEEDENTTFIGSASLGVVGDSMIISGDAVMDFLEADTNGEVTFLLTRDKDSGNFSLQSRENESGGGPKLQMMPHVVLEDADAYIRGGSNSDINYGSSEELVIKNAPSESYAREVYLRFNYEEEAGGSVQNATLTLTPTTVKADRTLRIHMASDSGDSWGEDEITWDNCPAASGEEVTFSSSDLTVDEVYSIDVTDLLNQDMNQNKIATFHIDALTQSGSGVNTFASRESSVESYWPVLDVTLYHSADLNEDGRVDYEDFVLLAQNWLTDDCSSETSDCDGADIDGDDDVDLDDMLEMADAWLLQL